MYVYVPVSEPHSVWNPLQFIKGKCKQSDFVAFKLDIDHEITESAIVNQLQNDEEAQSLIDEFYYEQHFRSGPFASIQYYLYSMYLCMYVCMWEVVVTNCR
jgi:hypothetical protein